MTTSPLPQRPGYRLIFTAFITTKNGTRIFAASRGLKAFAIWVRE